uniref:Proliferation-associated protein 1 n=1 Tax=Ulva partita TaxID=1605170 RepID=A0A1C9ZQI7_9CHLO|nr:proliferation-associated protein 1 [Ulva partita]
MATSVCSIGLLLIKKWMTIFLKKMKFMQSTLWSALVKVKQKF